ncbi:hypothetical protein Pla108_01610 [Botrimarina colliarenosi]|uniref:Uncharacterized protein n=1 Tax=Botrimarina colliarenosi TaxID=2528001 RepID=A0A5C6AIK9_9BACT|nr:hypothetical protein [Botrimarina colliarenosi]TWT99226.1 hypothetical protein Pla108_01610 [Botrimarina colliarenosi]
MPSLTPSTTGFSPWSRWYAIAADARLMTPPNTRHPRDEAPLPATAAAPAPAGGAASGASAG